MINNMNEFKNAYPNAVVVNYDFADIMEYGLAYRTSVGSMEQLVKVKGKFISYPYIQHYQKGIDYNIDIFIIHNHKTYQIERIEKNNPLSNYKIIREMDNVSPKLYDDDIFYQMYKKARKPKTINEPLLMIKG